MDEQHYLAPLFSPGVVAIIGATPREGALGQVLMQNMLAAGFKGVLRAVNPKYRQVQGVRCFRSIADVPERVDLAIIATPARTVPDIIAACGKARVRTAVILSAGFAEGGAEGAARERRVVQIAREHKLRILGPNSMGIARPVAGVNATFAHAAPVPGNIGFISQSGALCAAILDWAQASGVGFSNVVSLGGSCDLDFGEVLDYMIWDNRSEHILLYIEGVRDARRFMSALRTAARAKPVMVIKVGRHPQGMRAALSHTGAMVGDDAVFDAALRRAGVVRLKYLTQMFAATKALFTRFHPRGKRLAIITNGGGPGVMAADRAGDLGIPLAELAPTTVAQLNRLLPRAWSHANPVDLVGDADPERYEATVRTVLEDPGVDGLLTILTPQAMTRPIEVAERLVALNKTAEKPILACWMGETLVADARSLFEAHGIPSFRTPEPAIDLFSHISAYYENRRILTQTPAPLSSLQVPDVARARAVIEEALDAGRSTLTRAEARQVLAAFHIPVRATRVARSADEAVSFGYELGFPVILRPNAIQTTAGEPDLRRDPTSAVGAHLAYEELWKNLRERDPVGAALGLTVEPRLDITQARSLVVGVMRDAVFGPVITFGEFGTDTEGITGRTVSLPPLNRFLAADLIDSHRIAPRLGRWRSLPAIDRDALEQALLRISELVCELPWVRSLDIQPLFADAKGVAAVDVHMTVGHVPAKAAPYAHMAIHPYPAHLIQRIEMRDGRRVLVRPIMPEDAELEQEFVRRLSPETRYYRFMSALRELPPQLLAKLTQIDYDRELALLATMQHEGHEEEVGVCRYAVNADGRSCEFAIVVGDDFRGTGLAGQLMDILIQTAQLRGLREMKGLFLANNDRMIRFAQKIGFSLSIDPEDPSIKLGTLDILGYSPRSPLQISRS